MNFLPQSSFEKVEMYNISNFFKMWFGVCEKDNLLIIIFICSHHDNILYRYIHDKNLMSGYLIFQRLNCAILHL